MFRISRITRISLQAAAKGGYAMVKTKSSIMILLSSARLVVLLGMIAGLVLVLPTGATADKPGTPSTEACTPNSKSALDSGGGKASFEIPIPGIASSVWDDGTIGLTIPIENSSERTASDVQVTDVKVSDADTIEPASVPLGLGNMDPQEVKQVAAQVADRDGELNSKYHVIVRGHYASSGHGCNFTIAGFFSPSAASDSDTFPGHDGESILQRPQDAVYPELQPTPFTEPNAESPILIPPGPARQLFEPTETPSEGAAPAGAPLVDITENRNSSSNNAGTPPDPNAARGTNNVVLTTFNTGISYSLDGGNSFTDVNLFNPVPGQPSRTSFFPQSDGGLCCDQVVIYVPQQNLFV